MEVWWKGRWMDEYRWRSSAVWQKRQSSKRSEAAGRSAASLGGGRERGKSRRGEEDWQERMNVQAIKIKIPQEKPVWKKWEPLPTSSSFSLSHSFFSAFFHHHSFLFLISFSLHSIPLHFTLLQRKVVTVNNSFFLNYNPIVFVCVCVFVVTQHTIWRSASLCVCVCFFLLPKRVGRYL